MRGRSRNSEGVCTIKSMYIHSIYKHVCYSMYLLYYINLSDYINCITVLNTENVARGGKLRVSKM